MAVTQFVPQFTHVSRHFQILDRKQKISLGQTVLKMWSQKSTTKIALSLLAIKDYEHFYGI